LVTASWYLFPTLRFVVVPAVIVMIYAVTIGVLEARWRRVRHAEPFGAASGGTWPRPPFSISGRRSGSCWAGVVFLILTPPASPARRLDRMDSP
jgi:hypothetical protein